MKGPIDEHAVVQKVADVGDGVQTIISDAEYVS